MSPVGFETTISADERPETYALDRATIGTGVEKILVLLKCDKNNLYLHEDRCTCVVVCR